MRQHELVDVLSPSAKGTKMQGGITYSTQDGREEVTKKYSALGNKQFMRRQEPVSTYNDTTGDVSQIGTGNVQSASTSNDARLAHPTGKASH